MYMEKVKVKEQEKEGAYGEKMGWEGERAGEITTAWE